MVGRKKKRKTQARSWSELMSPESLQFAVLFRDSFPFDEIFPIEAFFLSFFFSFSLIFRRGFTITYGTCSLDDGDLSRYSYLKKRKKCKIETRVYVWLGGFKKERSRDFESMVWDWESLAWCLVGESR